MSALLHRIADNIDTALFKARMYWHLSLGFVVVLLTGTAVAWYFLRPHEVALLIGEPWQAMQERSTVQIMPDHFEEVPWLVMPHKLSTFRLADPEFGFTTPKAKFLTIAFDRQGRVFNVRMSPQVEPLTFEDTMAVVLDLQQQWKTKGWHVTDPKFSPAFDRSKAWQEHIQSCKPAATTFWQAANKYQVLLAVDCFEDRNHPNEARYLITMDIATPWVEPHDPSKNILSNTPSTKPALK